MRWPAGRATPISGRPLGPASPRASCGPPAAARVRDALSTGASLHVYETARRGPGELGAWLRAEQISAWWTVPPLAEAMLDADPDVRLPDLRSVVFSGEVLHRQVAERLRARLSDEAVISHRYGSSETGAVAVFRIRHDTVLDADIVPVGEPLPGVEIAILEPDSHGVGTIEVVSDRASPLPGRQRRGRHLRRRQRPHPLPHERPRPDPAGRCARAPRPQRPHRQGARSPCRRRRGGGRPVLAAAGRLGRGRGAGLRRWRSDREWVVPGRAGTWACRRCAWRCASACPAT